MKITANLFINPNGNLRVTKKDASSYPSELAVKLVIDVPDVFFNRPMPIVNLSIPKEYLISPDKEVVAKWIAPEIAEALKIEVKEIEDGLINAINLQGDKSKGGENK